MCVISPTLGSSFSDWIDLFGLYILFSHFRPRDATRGNSFFQMSSYARANLRITNEKTKGKFPWGHHVVWNGKTKCTSRKGLLESPRYFKWTIQFGPFHIEGEFLYSSCHTEFHTTWWKRRYVDSHACRFRTIFGWKAIYHSTWQKSIFLIAFARSLTIFACI